MTMRLTLAALLVLTACSTEPPTAPEPPRPATPPTAPEPPAPPRPPADTSPAQPASVTSLVGEWRVAGIDGRDFNEPYGLGLSGDAEEIWWAPRCAGLVRSYRIAGTSIRIGPAKGVKPRAPGEPTPPVCAIGLPPRIDEVTRALDSATTVRRTTSNGVELSGGGHSLLLFSQ